MCFCRRGHFVKIALRKKKCYKVMDIQMVDSKVVLTPSIFPIKSFTLGDTIEAAGKLSRNKLINALCINTLPVLEGEVVHSYDENWLKDHKERFDLYFSCCAVVECEIPKWAFYWHNRLHREYATTSVKLVKIIWNSLDREH